MFDHNDLEIQYHLTRQHQLDLRGKEYTALDRAVTTAVLNAMLKAELNGKTPDRKVMVHALPLPTGLGKTTATSAYIATRAKIDPEFSAVFMTPTAKLAEEVQLQIEELLGEGSTFLWSTYHAHDADPERSELELGHPITRRTRKSDLPSARIAIVTHRQLQLDLLKGIDTGTLSYNGHPRTVAIHDENLNLVHKVAGTADQLLKLHYRWAAMIPAHPWLPIIMRIVSKMAEHARTPGQRHTTLMTLTEDETNTLLGGHKLRLWDLTNDWESFERRCSDAEQMEDLALLLKSTARGESSYSRQSGRLSGFMQTLNTEYPSFILLDATCKLSNTVLLSEHVSCLDTIDVNYANLLTSYFVLPEDLREWSKVKGNMVLEHRYMQFIRNAVTANVGVGEYALVATHKALLKSQGLAGYSSPSNPVDWEGRKVCFINYGAGVGVNAFRDIQNVFTFNDYHPPREVTIAENHGWSRQALTDECLRNAEGVRALGGQSIPRGSYGRVHEGHILSTFKQIAMRGSARKVDEGGNCAPMRLFTTMDVSRLIPNFSSLFPGAPMPIKATLLDGANADHVRGRKGLVELLLNLRDRWEVSAEEVEVLTGVQRSKLTREFKACDPILSPLGWKLVDAKELGYGGKMKYAYNENLHAHVSLHSKNPLP